MKDFQLRDRSILDMIQEENGRQLDKWGVQDSPISEWMLWVMEEVGEVSQAISEYKYRGGRKDHVAHEAVQAATLLLKIAEGFMKEEGRIE